MQEAEKFKILQMDFSPNYVYSALLIIKLHSMLGQGIE